MNHEIVESFSQMVREKGIDKDVLVGIVEEVFSMMVKKKYGPDARFDVVVNMDKGDIEIYLEKVIVETVTDPGAQIDLESVRQKTDEQLEVGDDFVEVVDIKDFGRRLVVAAKQILNQRIKEIEKEVIYNEYSNTVGEIVVGEIYQIRKNEVLINHNKNELILPKPEQIYKDRYKKGQTIRAIVKEVRKNIGMPAVIVSRSDPRFLAKLFELEIPEIYDGIIEIKAIAREPGDRAKVAVESHDDRIDAVGACVGMKGVRIHSIVRELNNENIDVVNYSEDPVVFITRSLAPSKLKSVSVDREAKVCTVVVDKDQASLAIGRNGQNIRLASKLTGYEINLIREGGEEEYDMELSEFIEELGEDLYHKLFDEGYETARAIIDAKEDELIAYVGLDPEKIRELKEMMKRELEEAEVEEGGTSVSGKENVVPAEQSPKSTEEEKTGDEQADAQGVNEQTPANSVEPKTKQ
jgi:N utilization substance protein A